MRAFVFLRNANRLENRTAIAGSLYEVLQNPNLESADTLSINPFGSKKLERDTGSQTQSTFDIYAMGLNALAYQQPIGTNRGKQMEYVNLWEQLIQTATGKRLDAAVRGSINTKPVIRRKQEMERLGE